jgi:hypothetical protein
MRDRTTGQTVPFCCGLLAGDDWVQFLHRQGDWQGANFEIWRERDDDQDRVPDWKDRCPTTAPNERFLIDAFGCGPSERDKDQDGVRDNDDACLTTPVSERKLVDKLGCGPSERDSDHDRVVDALDKCPGTPAGEAVDETGCSMRQEMHLTIDATDPIVPGDEAQFSARLDSRSEGALRGLQGGLSYQWTVNGRLVNANNSFFKVKVPADINQPSITVSVRLQAIRPGRAAETLAQTSRTFQVKSAGHCGGRQWQLQVPNTKPEKKYTGPTRAECQYDIAASGTISDWADKTDGVDAVWCYAEWRCGKRGEHWQQLRIDGKGMSDLVGQTLAPQSSHRYQIRIKGTGKPLELYCSDAQGSWQDNKGRFDVIITELPSR